MFGVPAGKIGLIGVALILCVFGVRYLNKINVNQTTTNVIVSIENEEKVEPKLILFYNKLWGNKLWTGLETTERFNNWGGVPCKVRNCRVTYNKRLLPRADVVIFHAFGGDMLPPEDLHALTPQRHSDQIWIYFIHECPHNAKPAASLYDGLFNWTMNYRLDADITVLYNWEWGTWVLREEGDEPPTLENNYAEGKDKVIFGGISHCGTMRDLYIKKLQDYVEVDIYGKCSNIFHKEPKECKRFSEECKQLTKRYKFFLAMENSFCLDYATEKYWETIFDGNMIPIVLGGSDYSKLGIPKSYLNPLEFDTIEDFGNYIKYLDENDDAYNEYFAWRKKYKKVEAHAWSCKICEKINEGIKTRHTYNLTSWYGVENNCAINLPRMRQILTKSDVEKPHIDEYYKYESKI